MTIQEILEAHQRVKGIRGLGTRCTCGYYMAALQPHEELHRAHVAEMLEPVRAEAKQEALRDAASELENTAVSPIWCWDTCGDPKCLDDIEINTAIKIQRWLRDRANQHKEPADG